MFCCKSPVESPSAPRLQDLLSHRRSTSTSTANMILPDGSVKYVHGEGRPILTETGDVTDFIGTTMDITERKRREELLRNIQTELARVTRLTTVGELTASIAHEINQPLRWHGHGAFNLPFDRRCPWRSPLGIAGVSPGGGLPIYRANRRQNGF